MGLAHLTSCAMKAITRWIQKTKSVFTHESRLKMDKLKNRKIFKMIGFGGNGMCVLSSFVRVAVVTGS